ncbi:MAG: hypothetical protein AAGJ29_13150 [Pseudomonadota bacterium]
MRELFNQDRPMSPGLIRSGVQALGLLLAAAAFVVVFYSLWTIFSGHVIPGILQATAGLGLLLALYLIVRLLGEGVMALHRLNDRMTVLSNELAAQRTKGAEAEPAQATPTKKRRAAAKKASSTVTETETPADTDA